VRQSKYAPQAPAADVQHRVEEPPLVVEAGPGEGQLAVEVLGGDIFLLDLDARTVTRLTAPFLFRQVYALPGSGQDPIRGPKMRRDGRALPLRRLVYPRAGHRLDMDVDAWETAEPRRWVTPTITYLWHLPLAPRPRHGDPR
jgi:hypothetical protein